MKEFNKMMGYPLEAVEALANRAKEINERRIVKLCQRDLAEKGIEND